MISEAEVSKAASVTGTGIGDKCGTATNSHQDIPNRSGSDLNQANDLDKSYVFVTGADGLPDDPAGDVDAISVSQNVKLDAGTGQVDEFLDEERIGSVELYNGDFPERTDKSVADPEAKPIEDPSVKNPSMIGVSVDDVVKPESIPAPVENQESQVGLGAPELASESSRNGDLSNMSLHIGASGCANGGCEDQNTNSKGNNQVDISSTEKLQENQGVGDCNSESQDVSLVDVDEVKVSRQLVGGAEADIPSSGSLELDMETHTVNNREEMHDDGTKATLSLDIHEHQQLVTALEDNSQCVLEHRDETKTVANSTDCHAESVCDLMLEEKSEGSASLVGNGIQHAEEPETHPGGSGIPHKTMHAESKTKASPLPERVLPSTGHPPETEREISDIIPPSSAHPPETEREFSDAESKTEASLLPEIIPPSSAHTPETEREISDAESKTEASLLPEIIPPSSAHPPETETEISDAERKTEASLLPEVTPPSSAHPPETEREVSDAESKTEASLLTETVPPSSDHPPETESEISDDAVIETVSSLLVGRTSQTMENEPLANDSAIRSTADEVLLAQVEPTFQDGEVTAETEVSSGFSEAADSQPARIDVKLEPGVYFHDNSTISNGEKMDAVVDTCTTEVLDRFNAENGSVDNALLVEIEAAQIMGDQLDAAADDSHENVLLQENEHPRKSETFVLTSEPDVHVSDTSSNGGKIDALYPTYRTEVLNSFNVGGVMGTALQVEGVQNLVDQSDGAAGCNHENMGLQENEVTGKPEVFDVNSECGVNILHFSAASSEENTGALPGACRIVILDKVVNEGVANTGLEIKGAQYKGDQLDCPTGESHEETILQENEAIGNCETSDLKLECENEHVHSFSTTRSGEKTDEVSSACITEVLDNYNVDKEGMENNELETQDFQNTGGKKSDGAAGSNNENLILQEYEATRKSGSDYISEAEPEGSVSNTIARGEVGVKAITKPFNFLVRVPRFDDDDLREQIRLAKLDVDEKTKIRDAIQVLVQEKRANTQIHGVDYEYARTEGRTARNLVKSKRIEIDSLQSMINKAKNALSIDDIDGRIQNMERMIQHETLPLKEEKQLIREIKQMKQLREQLSSNLGNKDEIKHALEQREEFEERLKTLRKELDVLKDQVLKAEAASLEARTKYDDENKKVRELQAQFRAANDVRQLAYAQMQSLRTVLSKKNEHFFKCKDASAVASNYAFCGNTEALYHFCIEDVKNFMELWNTDNEFRKDYVRCNARSTIRRLGTFDGRSLGLDEQPPILPSYAEARTGSMIPAPVKVDVASEIPIPELKQETTVNTVPSDGKSMQKVEEHKTQKMANKETAAPVIENGYDLVSDGVHEEPKKSADEMRREEAEANKLKEQRRLEALAKADEARERKKRRAEKLLMRAELKLQKEAEQREKEREKRLRKKERKKAGTIEVNDTNHHSETAPSSESASEISKDMEVKDMPAATATPTVTAKKPQKRWMFTKQSKSKTIPPPLRSRNKRKLLQQWMWVGFASLLILFLFWMGNVSLFSNGIPKRYSPLHSRD